MHSTSSPPLLQWTDNDDANSLIAGDPMALLIGFCLDQQVTVEKAFSGPLVILERLGTLEADALACMDAATVEAAFARPPAVHRFPASMARRVQSLCAVVAGDYAGNAASIWETAKDAADLMQRVRALPGFGEMKAVTVFAVLVKRFGVTLPGADRLMPDRPTLGDVSTADQRRAYQAHKRARKAELRAADSPPGARGAARPGAMPRGGG